MAQHLDPEEIEKQLINLSPDPFRKLLAGYLKVEPTEAALQEFCNKYPDRFAQGITMLRGMCGYKDAPPVQNNTLILIQTMSDSELRAYRDELERQIGELQSKQKVLPPHPKVKVQASTTDGGEATQ